MNEKKCSNIPVKHLKDLCDNCEYVAAISLQYRLCSSIFTLIAVKSHRNTKTGNMNAKKFSKILVKHLKDSCDNCEYVAAISLQ